MWNTTRIKVLVILCHVLKVSKSCLTNGSMCLCVSSSGILGRPTMTLWLLVLWPCSGHLCVCVCVCVCVCGVHGEVVHESINMFIL